MNELHYAKSLVDSWITEDQYYQCIELIERSRDFKEESEHFGIDEEFYLVWMLAAWVGLAFRSGVHQFYESYRDHTGKVSRLLRKYRLGNIAEIFDQGGYDPENNSAMDQIDHWIYANEKIVHRFAFEYFEKNREMLYRYGNCKIT